MFAKIWACYALEFFGIRDASQGAKLWDPDSGRDDQRCSGQDQRWVKVDESRCTPGYRDIQNPGSPITVCDPWAISAVVAGVLLPSVAQSAASDHCCCGWWSAGATKTFSADWSAFVETTCDSAGAVVVVVAKSGLPNGADGVARSVKNHYHFSCLNDSKWATF